MDNSSQLPPNNGEPVDALTQSAELDAYFAALHERFATNADAPVGAALAEFVDVIDLAPIPQPAVTSPTTSWRPKMLTGIGAFVATTTGKIVLGTTVAAASVGGMHAAEIVDVPLLPEPAPAEVLMVDAEDDAEIEATDSTTGEIAESAAEVDDTVEPAEDADTDAVADDMDDQGSDEADLADEEPKNHGAVVSDFAKNTELEGCEKGQAIAALAQSKDKKNDDGEDESDDDTDEVSTSAEDADVEEDAASTCGSDSDDEDDDSTKDDEDDDEDDDSAEDGDDEEGDGPPEGKGNNRDDHPGKGKSQADSDE